MAELAHDDVTVVVPAYNAAETIERTLRSITSQSERRPHLLVIDDASTDQTAALAAQLGATVLPGGGTGPGGARNIGIHNTVTPLVAFCDADDEWTKGRLDDDLDHFRASPDTDILLGTSRYETDDPALLDGHNFDNDDRCALIPHFGAATIRTDVFASVGTIDSGRRNYEDYEFFQRARDLGATIVEHARVAQVRHLIATSVSHQHPASPPDLLAVLRESVQRRRTSDTPPRDNEMKRP
jgi:glycosyltransferase involved in cell wall biosynthesis